MRSASLLPLCWALSLVASAPAIGADAPHGVEVTHLANAGFLLRGGDRAVLIDAFVVEPYVGYEAVPATVWQQLLERQPPFSTVDVALVSHRHRDHFQPQAARTFLLHHPETVLVAADEVVAELRDGWDGWPAVAARVVERTPAPGQPRSFALPGLVVDLFELPHGSARTLPLNVAHLVQLGGRSVIHVGDAEASLADLRAAGLVGRRADVALLPFWFWLEASRRESLTALAATVDVAVHWSRADLSDHAGALLAADPAVVVFRAPLETRRF